jgi:hypothetical protein
LHHNPNPPDRDQKFDEILNFGISLSPRGMVQMDSSVSPTHRLQEVRGADRLVSQVLLDFDTRIRWDEVVLAIQLNAMPGVEHEAYIGLGQLILEPRQGAAQLPPAYVGVEDGLEPQRFELGRHPRASLPALLRLGSVAYSSLPITRATRVSANTTPAALAKPTINANAMRSCFIKKPFGFSSRA